MFLGTLLVYIDLMRLFSATSGVADYWRQSNVIRRNQLVARARDSIISNWHPAAMPGTPAWNQYYSTLSSWARETLRVTIVRPLSYLYFFLNLGLPRLYEGPTYELGRLPSCFG